MLVPLVLPPDGEQRDWRERAWEWVLARYHREHPSFDVITGTTEAVVEHPYPWCWSKGAAVADARARADADVLVIADADCFVTPASLVRACQAALEGPWAVPYVTVRRLGPDATRQLLMTGAEHELSPAHLDRYEYAGIRGGGIFAIKAETWDRVPVPDPAFRGWGGEDEAAGIALTTLVGPPVNLDGHCWHLWHPHAMPGARGPIGHNQLALLKRYSAASGDVERMRAIIEGR